MDQLPLHAGEIIYKSQLSCELVVWHDVGRGILKTLLARETIGTYRALFGTRWIENPRIGYTPLLSLVAPAAYMRPSSLIKNCGN